MKLKNKYRIVTFIAAIIICLVVIHLNLTSHEKTQKIYLEQAKKIIMNQKKDFLKDTVNNIYLEIDRVRVTKYNNYKKNIESRLRRFQEEYDLSDKEFVKFFRERFDDDANPKMWTALLWDSKTGEILYDSYKMPKGTIGSTVESLESSMSSYAVIKKGSIEGRFGVSKSYIDELVKEEVADLIRSSKFSNESYIWVNEVINYEGGKDYAIRRVHPNLKDTEGDYLSTDMEDIKGNLPYLEELEGIKKSGEIFFTYNFKKLNSSQISEKITYAKLYKEYNWIIAMGVHLDDIDAYTEEINNEIRSLSSGAIIGLIRYILVVLLIGFILLYLLDKLHVSASTKSLEKEINLDTLTNAASRRCGERNLNAFFKQYKLTGEKPVIMMFDIDNFKHINDCYGHSAGDIVLKEIVKTIYHIIRSSDQLIRWGGDEFVGILPGLREDYIVEFGEKLLDEISSIQIPLENGTIGVTISVGFSYFMETDNNCKDVLKRADEALYKSKEQGKNRINIL
jgi:diguanylate cyclase (GGDEF)-like protein